MLSGKNFPFLPSGIENTPDLLRPSYLPKFGTCTSPFLTRLHTFLTLLLLLSVDLTENSD